MPNGHHTTDEIEWVDLTEYPGYRVSNTGEVESQRRSGRLTGRWHRLKPNTHKQGYKFFRVRTQDGVFVARLGHRLVLAAFVGPPPQADMQACHNDGNPGNNVLANLRWGTRKDNAADMLRHGTRQMGERHGDAKLTEADVRTIRAEYASGATITDLAARYGMTRSPIFLVVRRRTWKHVE